MNIKDSQFPYTAEHGSVSYLEAMHRMTVAESRVRELEAKCFNLEAEREPLIHDLERHIAIAAQEADARLKAEAELASREPSKSQIKRISAMVESAEIKRLKAEVGRLREAMVYTATLLEPFDGDAEELGGSMAEAVVALRAALQGEG